MHVLARAAIAVSLTLAGAQATADAQSTSRRSSDRNTLTADEIEASTSATVYQLIQQKRPHWLSPRGTSTLRTRTGTDRMTGERYERPADPQIAVYVDEVRNGSQDVLRSMSSDTVDMMEYLNAASATQRFGTNHEYGAILVRRRIR